MLFVALAAVASGAAAPSAKRTATVRPGVAIGGVVLGGLSSEQARNAISWWYNRPLRFVFYGRHWSVRPAALGASVDTVNAVQEVLRATPSAQLSLRVNVDRAQIQKYVRALDRRLSVEPTRPRRSRGCGRRSSQASRGSRSTATRPSSGSRLRSRLHGARASCTQPRAPSLRA